MAEQQGTEKQQIEILKSELDTIKSSLDVKIKQCEEYESEMETIKQSNNKLLTECEEYKTQINEMQLTNETLQSHIQSNNPNNNEFDALIKENTHLKTEEKQLNEKLICITNENQNYIKQNNLLTQNIFDKDKKYKSHNQTITKLKDQIITLNNTLKDKNEEILALETDLTHYENQINELKSSNASELGYSEIVFKRESTQKILEIRKMSKEINQNEINDLLQEIDDLSPISDIDSPHSFPAIIHGTKEIVSEFDFKDIKQQQNNELRDEIRKELKQEFAKQIDTLKDEQKKYENMFSLFVKISVVVLILFIVIVFMLRGETVCDECAECDECNCEQMMNKHTDL